ncbi:hypothetical protein HN873_033399 [Arachis hypogaea]
MELLNQLDEFDQIEKQFRRIKNFILETTVWFKNICDVFQRSSPFLLLSFSPFWSSCCSPLSVAVLLASLCRGSARLSLLASSPPPLQSLAHPFLPSQSHRPSPVVLRGTRPSLEVALRSRRPLSSSKLTRRPSSSVDLAAAIFLRGQQH